MRYGYERQDHKVVRRLRHVIARRTMQSLDSLEGPPQGMSRWMEIIPSQTLRMLQVLTQSGTQSSRLLELPPETLINVFEEADPLDRVALALTCKSLLSVAILHKIKTIEPKSHRAPWSNNPAWEFTDFESTRPECECRLMEDLLKQIWPLNAKGRKDHTIQICVDCLRLLPKRKGYWIVTLTKLQNKYWTADAVEDWVYATKMFSSGVKIQCPRCRMQEHGSIIQNELQYTG